MSNVALKNGLLSLYGFTCGYIQVATKTGLKHDFNNRIELYIDGCWCIGIRIDGEKVVSDFFNSYKDAYTEYKRLVKQKGFKHCLNRG